MSIVSLKVKEAKGKQKNFPKLKTILASPFQERCPSLDDGDLHHFKQILCAAIEESALEPLEFATKKHLHLGLESSMRAINNRRSSCVLLSLSIKPRYLISLIARNQNVKDETVPVYVVAQLAKLSEELFGVRSLALVLPSIAEIKELELGTDLEDWISARTKPKKESKIEYNDAAVKVKKNRKMKISAPLKADHVETVPDIPKVVEQKSWSGNFISFSNSEDIMEVEESKLEEDKQRLLGVLNKMSNRIKEMPVKKDAQMETNIPIAKEDDVNSAAEAASDSDDFLQVYQPLVVHKIRPNPDRKPKKKRKKNKVSKK